MAGGKLRRLLARNKSFNCTGVKIGNAALVYETANGKSALRGRGPAKILDVDQTGATAKPQSQTFIVARLCVR